MSTLLESSPCLVCRGREYAQVGSLDRHGEPLATIACTNCGLIRHRQIPSQDELRQFYASRYRQSYHGETQPSPRRVMRAWKNGIRIATQLQPYLRPESRVFEVGAGIGCNLKALERAGFRATGIEPHLGFQQYASQSVRVPVSAAYLQEMPARADFDLVLLIHVIEHLRSPDADVARIRQLLRESGMFYVECPNFSAPFARRARLFHYAHIFNFLPETLRSLVEQQGYRLMRRFSDDHDPNLQMLFVRDTPRREIPYGGYEKVRQILDSDNPLRYYTRPRYLGRSATRLARMAWEGVAAGPTVRELERSWAA